MSEKPLIVGWRKLKEMGWPYSRAETWRRMSRGDFPKASKLGKHRNAHPVWRVTEVLSYLESYGLKVTDDWYAP